MIKQEFPKSEKVKIFLNEYYFGYGSYHTFVRIFGGPITLALGIYLYLYKFDQQEAFAIFTIIYSIYYILKPLFIILKRKDWFENFDQDYTIEPDKLIIQKGNSRSELDYSEFELRLKRKTYYVLKTKAKQAIYFPKSLLEPYEIEILDKLVEK
ncbi:MAG: YcxB family protein [Crocinitomicaceae bacterium]|nr:YcxB family protein [Crocinitomicaceae bacterium]